MVQWFSESGLSKLTAAIAAAGGELRLVGGAVRDHVMGRAVRELDAATTLLPDAVIRVAEACGYKTIPTGIAHGTVTVVLPERTLEITTLRKDVACDGRHAHVEYTDDWQADASRRDFTINALYMDAHSTIYDYFDGQQHIAMQRVQFIGDAQQRIEEDALRILRFYRFLATHGTAPADAAAQTACAEKREMIGQLSGERIAQEMRKLLSASDPIYSLEQMHHAQVDVHVLGSALAPAALPLLHAVEQREQLQPDWMVRLICCIDLAQATTIVHSIAARWKLSNKESQALDLLARSALLLDEDVPLTHKKYLRRHGSSAYIRLLLVSAAHGLLTRIDHWLQLVHTWVPPEFPLTSQDVMARGYSGKALGEALKQAETLWEESEYRLSAAALLKTIA